MIITLIFFLFTLIISLLVFFISMFFMENKNNEISEEPFECGFEPISYSRTPFSIQFFSITIVFLIFDLEIVILLPLMKSFAHYWVVNTILSLITFILLLGLIIEWYDGSLNWTM